MKAIIYLLISKNRLIYSPIKRQSNRIIVQEIKYDKKDKVKTTVKDKIKISIKFFEKVLSKR